MAILLPSNARNARKRERVARPIKPPRAERFQYFRDLAAMVDPIKAATMYLSDLISSGASRMVAANRIAQLMDETQARVDMMAPQVAGGFVDRVSQSNKQQIERSIASSLGVDFASILDEGTTASDIRLALSRNTALIKSIPAQHWNEVAQAVVDNYGGKALPGDVSLRTRLQQIGNISEGRAQLIARDQTAKLTGSLNQSRQTANGIEEYDWRNSQDERVVGRPGGLYPKGTRRHEDHWSREGKRFRWDDPPSDGHPGEPIQCRCTAAPVIDLEKLKAKYA